MGSCGLRGTCFRGVAAGLSIPGAGRSRRDTPGGREVQQRDSFKTGKKPGFSAINVHKSAFDHPNSEPRCREAGLLPGGEIWKLNAFILDCPFILLHHVWRSDVTFPCCEVTSMKRLAMTAFVLVFAAAAASDAQAGLMNLFYGGGGCCPSSCCRPARCCAPAPTCCRPAPVCCRPAPVCCRPAPTCCHPAPTCCGPGAPSTAPNVPQAPKVPYEEKPPAPKKETTKPPAPKKGTAKPPAPGKKAGKTAGPKA